MRKYTVFIIIAGCVLILALSAVLGFTLYNAYTKTDEPPLITVDGSDEDVTQAAFPGNDFPTGDSAGNTTVSRSLDTSSAADTSISDVLEPDVPAISEDAAQYVLSLLDGYVAVFYHSDGGAQVKEVTATPVNALSQDERQRLAAGIMVFNDEQLARLLQDYGS